MTAAIRVRDLRKRFGEIAAVEDVSFEAAGASVLALLGPNGAGKTTITRVLATILAPDGGTAEIMGRGGCCKSVGRGCRAGFFGPVLTPGSVRLAW